MILMFLSSFSFFDACMALLIGVPASLIAAWAYDAFGRKKKYHLCFWKNYTQQYWSQNNGPITVSVKYKEQEVKSSLLLLSLVIENDGKQAIKYDTHFSKEIKIKSKLLKILSAEAVEGPAKASCELENNEVCLSWDIFKPKERIIIKMVAEPSSDYEGFLNEDTFFDSLVFDFRADCIEKIESEKKPLFSADEFMGRLFPIIFMLVSSIFICGCVLSSSTRYEQFLKGTGERPISLCYSYLLNRYLVSGDSLILVSPEDMPSELVLSPIDRSSFYSKTALCVEIIFAIDFLLGIIGIVVIVMRRKRMMKEQTAFIDSFKN